MASRGINKVILIGNLGNDPEVRYTPNGSAVTNVNIATTSGWRDKQTGELQERTEWHRIVFFNRLAEVAGEYLHKGSKVYIEGSLRTRKWQDKSGTDRYTTEIISTEMQILDSRHSNNNSHSSSSSSSSSSSNTHSNQAENTNKTAAGTTTATTDLEDDIPF